MFGLFFHPRRSDPGGAVAVRVVAGHHCGETTDAPPIVVAHDPAQTKLNRAPGSIGNVTSDTSHSSTALSTLSRP